MPAHRILPPRRKLRRLYVAENRSIKSIADEYGVTYRSVLNTLKRDARIDDEPWPLKQVGRGEWKRRKSEAIRAGRDEVLAILVVAEIREALIKYHLTQHQFAALSGISQSQLSRLLATANRYTRRATALKVEAAVRDLEKRAAISAGVRKAREASA